MIHFTTTAMARPEIFSRTIRSFRTNLRGVDLNNCAIHINIDPLPVLSKCSTVVNMCGEHFGYVFSNIASVPNFSGAVNWVWSSAVRHGAEYIFHLEDDWVLKEPINVDDLFGFFKRQPNLYQVALRAYEYKYEKCVLSPSVISRRMFGNVAGKLDVSINPEVQLRGRKFGLELPFPQDNIGVDGKVVVFPDRVVLKDIGREWLNNTKYRKPSKKNTFTSWVEG